MRASGLALPTTRDLAAAAGRWTARAAEVAVRRRRWIVLACVLGWWAFVYDAAMHLSFHNHWAYSDGDDGPWYWTAAWALSSLHVASGYIGFGWPYLLSPIAAIAGPNLANGLPAVIGLNVLVLGPLAVVGMYLLGKRLAGELFGLWTAVLWVVLPILALVMYRHPERTTVMNDFLPSALGLNVLSDFPSVVCAIYAGYLVLRVLDSNATRDAALVGVVLGFLVLLKPGNGPLPVAAAVALLARRQLRALVVAGVAMVPGLLAQLVWKRTGTGGVPLLRGTGGGSVSPGGVPSGGAGRPAPAHAGLLTRLADNVHNYINLDWAHLGFNWHVIAWVFWSYRLLELGLVAGLLGLFLRHRARALFVAAWFLLFVLIKASAPWSNVTDTSTYRFLLPAWPAWILIVAGLVFCAPLGTRARERQRSEDDIARRALVPVGRRVLVVAAVLLGVVPLAVAAAASPVRPEVVGRVGLGAPVALQSFSLRVRQVGPHHVRLTWAPVGSRRVDFAYRVFKGPTDGCTYPIPGPPVCVMELSPIATLRATSLDDTQAVGHNVYRVAVAPEIRLDPNTQGYLLLSTPVSITVH